MELLTRCVRGQVTRLSTCVSVVVVCVFLQGVVYVLPISCLVIHQVSFNILSTEEPPLIALLICSTDIIYC